MIFIRFSNESIFVYKIEGKCSKNNLYLLVGKISSDIYILLSVFVKTRNGIASEVHGHRKAYISHIIEHLHIV